MDPKIVLLTSPEWQDYELLDSGNQRKLERFGPYLFIRPEHQALWSPALPAARWETAQAVFHASAGEETGGKWEYRRPIDKTWQMHYKDLAFEARSTSSRHLGVFPEQAVLWDWISQKIWSAKRPIKVLNLFGYTGLASLGAAQAGAVVTHVDASQKSITWARRNQELSGLVEKPIRWIVDDALKFVLREGRRGMQYDGIVLDPPKFGRGPKGEIWECIDMLPGLLQACRSILSPKPLFIIITAYAIRASALSLYHAVHEVFANGMGEIMCGELLLREHSAGRLLSMAIFARWYNSAYKMPEN